MKRAADMGMHFDMIARVSSLDSSLMVMMSWNYSLARRVIWRCSCKMLLYYFIVSLYCRYRYAICSCVAQQKRLL